jgi:hypothetical protein
MKTDSGTKLLCPGFDSEKERIMMQKGLLLKSRNELEFLVCPFPAGKIFSIDCGEWKIKKHNIGCA